MQPDRPKPFKSGKDGLLFICDSSDEATSRKEINALLAIIVDAQVQHGLKGAYIDQDKWEAYETKMKKHSGEVHGFSAVESSAQGIYPYVYNHDMPFFADGRSLYEMCAASEKHVHCLITIMAHVQNIVPFSTCCQANTSKFMGRHSFVKLHCEIIDQFPFQMNRGEGTQLFAVDTHILNNEAMEARKQEIVDMFAEALAEDNYSTPIMEHTPYLLDSKHSEKYSSVEKLIVHVYVVGEHTYMGLTDGKDVFLGAKEGESSVMRNTSDRIDGRPSIPVSILIILAFFVRLAIKMIEAAIRATISFLVFLYGSLKSSE